ncbi:hypothetical protein C6496_16560 [Candidatus Poribacteria bacterium]|nr:MAG: hypothetical protein C6496_16560 [Candidatus Poribacteria bacterium]
MDLRINETLPIDEVGNLAYRGAKADRKPHLPFSRLVGTVSNSTDTVRLEIAPARDESVYLFLEFTIVKG